MLEKLKYCKDILLKSYSITINQQSKKKNTIKISIVDYSNGTIKKIVIFSSDIAGGL